MHVYPSLTPSEARTISALRKAGGSLSSCACVGAKLDLQAVRMLIRRGFIEELPVDTSYPPKAHNTHFLLTKRAHDITANVVAPPDSGLKDWQTTVFTPSEEDIRASEGETAEISNDFAESPPPTVRSTRRDTCICGCNSQTKSFFSPGHDGRIHKLLESIVRLQFAMCPERTRLVKCLARTPRMREWIESSKWVTSRFAPADIQRLLSIGGQDV